MALPIFGRFMASLKRDKAYRNLISASFPEPMDTVQAMLDCPLYLTDDEYLAKQEADRFLTLLERIFGSRKRNRTATKDLSEAERQQTIDALIQELSKPRQRTMSEESARIQKRNERLRKKRDRQKKRKEAWKKIFGG